MTDNVEIRKQVGLALQAPSAFTSAKIYPVNRPALLDIENEPKLKAYSSNTAKVYLGEFSQLLLILKHHPVNELTPERLKSYLLYGVNGLKLYVTHLHSRLNALHFYFEHYCTEKIFLSRYLGQNQNYSDQSCKYSRYSKIIWTYHPSYA